MESSLEFSSSLSSSTLPPPRTRIFKIIVIGDSGVGKTCLTYRFCAGKFPDKTEATIGVDFREKIIEIDGEKIKVRGGEGAEIGSDLNHGTGKHIAGVMTSSLVAKQMTPLSVAVSMTSPLGVGLLQCFDLHVT